VFAPDLAPIGKLPTLEQVLRRRERWTQCVFLNQLLDVDKPAGVLAADHAGVTCVAAVNGAAEFEQWRQGREKYKALWRARIFATPHVLARFERRC